MRNEKAMVSQGMQDGSAIADQIGSSRKTQEGEVWANARKEMQKGPSIQ